MRLISVDSAPSKSVLQAEAVVRNGGTLVLRAGTSAETFVHQAGQMMETTGSSWGRVGDVAAASLCPGNR